jgi:hypothetical protein
LSFVDTSDGLCIKQKCVSLNSLISYSRNKCALNGQLCSGNGVCDNNEQCHCHLGWDGHLCEHKQPDTSVNLLNPTLNAFNKESGLTGLTKPDSIAFRSSSFVSILLSLGAFSILVLLVLLLLYCQRRLGRRRNHTKTNKLNQDMDTIDATQWRGQLKKVCNAFMYITCVSLKRWGFYHANNSNLKYQQLKIKSIAFVRFKF